MKRLRVIYSETVSSLGKRETWLEKNFFNHFLRGNEDAHDFNIDFDMYADYVKNVKEGIMVDDNRVRDYIYFYPETYLTQNEKFEFCLRLVAIFGVQGYGDDVVVVTKDPTIIEALYKETKYQDLQNLVTFIYLTDIKMNDINPLYDGGREEVSSMVERMNQVYGYMAQRYGEDPKAPEER